MGALISIIIPNYNGQATIGKCLEAAFACSGGEREVIVVDDASEDGSVGIISRYPCRLIRLPKRSGASAARNAGAYASTGEALFFIDSDCLLTENALSVARDHLPGLSPRTAVGGTYTPVPYDSGFFSRFQSVFVNFFETKNTVPDYLATHAFIMRRNAFIKTGGFAEDFLPILEDVEFCHRLRRAGYRLIMDPGIQVRHIFNFTLMKSIKNAARKSRYWTLYSLANGDILSDSGTASRGIKIAGAAWLGAAAAGLASFVPGWKACLALVPALLGMSIIVNRHLLAAYRRTFGRLFAIAAGFYFSAVYPSAVWTGAFAGMLAYPRLRKAASERKGEGPEKSAAPDA